ncbi:LLM class flavin-dependent oxidoreductase [Dictyobacter kobayashii]|uniref:Luciferase-like protein n=1 Tax=Dictyobacter kobayashii TaxID=2014872 RepID=A0A402ASK4_9CHLR|nr:LLM class flavin-dependent oxidoreductase [Dictyobacter kobayashii]GCE22067.1 luciferase-like protein [Dictyobacter kobayashii]
MRYGLYIPNFGAQTSARSLATLAQEAEESGWDGIFLWDHILYKTPQSPPMVDPWVALTAMAMVTKRIRLGTTVTPLPRRRPWKLARETVTLDHLSEGRLTLGVGLGHPGSTEFAQFGEPEEDSIRAAKLDEGLDVLTGLWSGKPFSYKGEHYQLQRTTFLPSTLQSPRIPVWVAGFWPRVKPFRRAARWDGVVPLKSGGPLTPEDILDIRTTIQSHGQTSESFDIVKIHSTGLKDRKRTAKSAEAFAASGVTWWLESLFGPRDSFEDMRDHIRQGPPQR